MQAQRLKLNNSFVVDYLGTGMVKHDYFFSLILKAFSSSSFALICIFNTQPQAKSHLVKVGVGVMMNHFRRTHSAQ